MYDNKPLPCRQIAACVKEYSGEGLFKAFAHYLAESIENYRRTDIHPSTFLFKAETAARDCKEGRGPQALYASDLEARLPELFELLPDGFRQKVQELYADLSNPLPPEKPEVMHTEWRRPQPPNPGSMPAGKKRGGKIKSDRHWA